MVEVLYDTLTAFLTGAALSVLVLIIFHLLGYRWEKGTNGRWTIIRKKRAKKSNREGS